MRQLFRKKTVAIDVGNKNIHIIEGRCTGNFIEVEKAVLVTTPPGSFADGKIDDRNLLKESLQTALLDNKVDAKKAVVTIHSSSIITREFILPEATPDQLKNIVKYEIEQYLPIVSREYNIEYKVVEELIDDNIKKVRVQVAAMPRDIVVGYYNFLKSLNLKPLALDIHSNSISKLFARKLIINNENYSWDSTSAVIDVGSHSFNINIISNGRIQYSRSISSGGRELDKAIATNFNLSLERAEQKKINQVYLKPDEEPSSSDLNHLIKSILDQWIGEVQKVFQYYSTRCKESKIDSIYLHGGGSNLKGLSEYTEGILNIPTVKVNDISFIRPGEGLSEFSKEYFLNAAGAMIRL